MYRNLVCYQSLRNYYLYKMKLGDTGWCIQDFIRGGLYSGGFEITPKGMGFCRPSPRKFVNMVSWLVFRITTLELINLTKYIVNT